MTSSWSATIYSTNNLNKRLFNFPISYQILWKKLYVFITRINFWEMTSTVWIVVFIFITLINFAAPSNKPNRGKKTNLRTEEKLLLDDILGKGRYDRKIRPSSQNKTADGKDYTVVIINLMIRSINKIDDYNMEFSIQMTFREQWDDDRLKYRNHSLEGNEPIHYLTLTDANKIWMPDLFFKNEKTGHFHKIILPNTYIRIYPDGSVLYSIRISLTLACQMDLKLYPLDTQKCELRMASYGWTTDDLVFMWMDNEPVQVTKNLHLPRFLLKDFKHLDCRSNTTTGTYSCLLVNLFFKREFSYYLIQYYLPCCMLVIVSWVSFWLDQGAVPARVALGVTTLLTMSTQNAGINQSLPPVSYTKAIDVWTGACLTFVFSALLEFALVNYASRVDFRHDMSHAESLHPDVFEGVVISNEIDPRTGEVEDYPSYSASHGYYGNSLAYLRSIYGDDYVPEGKENGDIFGDSTLSVFQRSFSGCEMHSATMMPKTRHPIQLWLSKFPSRSKRIDVIARIFFPIVFALFNLAYWTTYLKHPEIKEINSE